jgi:cation:H+ antiporter
MTALLQLALFTANLAVRMVTSFGVSRLIVGQMIVAIGTCLPELATSVVAVYNGEADISVGSVLGSNVFNLLMRTGKRGKKP